eukprot:2944485-Pyramimonas_sp.AAC.1
MQGAHRYLAKEEAIQFTDGCLDPSTMERGMDPTEGIELRRKAWEARCAKHNGRVDEASYQVDLLKKRAQEELEDRPYHDIENPQSALDSFPAKSGKGPDQSAPDQVRAPSPSCKEGFLTILDMCEGQLQWPPQLTQNWRATPPKGGKHIAGEYRPIDFLPMPVRAWGKMTKQKLTKRLWLH